MDDVPLVTMTGDLICQDPSLKDIRVDVESSAPPLLADAEMLKIVFQNLLVNSARDTGAGQIDVAIGSSDSTCQIASPIPALASLRMSATRSSLRSIQRNREIRTWPGDGKRLVKARQEGSW